MKIRTRTIADIELTPEEVLILRNHLRNHLRDPIGNAQSGSTDEDTRFLRELFEKLPLAHS